MKGREDGRNRVCLCAGERMSEDERERESERGSVCVCVRERELDKHSNKQVESAVGVVLETR